MNENEKVTAMKEAHENIESNFDENELYQIDNMSLEDKKEKLERCKRSFEWKLENTYRIENQNDMTRINDDKVNKIAEWNLLHDIINPPKCTKNLNTHYSPILNGCMNTRHGREKFKNFWILLDSGCSSTIVMGRLVKDLILKNILWRSGTHRMVILLPTLRLTWINLNRTYRDKCRDVELSRGWPH